MRKLFLSLVLANLLLLAWQFWIEPVSLVPPATGPNSLVLFHSAPGPTAGGPEQGTRSTELPGNCFRLGPLASTGAAQQAGERLAARGIQATPIARDTPVWLGHWVQIAGFASAKDAAAARERLVAGGLADAYLMEDGAQPMLSLGVFRDRGRADRVAGVARSLGFQVALRDRYRPTVEQWLLISPRPDQTLKPADLSLAGDRIMRAEAVPCAEAVSPPPPVAALPATGQPQ